MTAGAPKCRHISTRLAGKKAHGFFEALPRHAQAFDLLAHALKFCLFGGQMPVSRTGNMSLLRGLALPAPSQRGIDSQVGSGFRDPVAMFRHQTARCTVELRGLLTPLF